MVNLGGEGGALEVNGAGHVNPSTAPNSMNWIWLNIPLALLITALMVGVPLWVTLRLPEAGEQRATVPSRTPVPAAAAARRAPGTPFGLRQRVVADAT